MQVSNYPPSLREPLTSYLRCTRNRENNICLLWKNNDGCNKHIRKHLGKDHMSLYTETAREAGLKSVHSSVPAPDKRMEESSATRLPMNTYTKEGFEEYLARWCYMDDTVRIGLIKLQVIL